MDEEIRLYCEKRAEYELAAAEAAEDDRHRRKHYFQASLYLNLLYGGDPRTEAPLGFTY